MEHLADTRPPTFQRFVRKWAHPNVVIYTDGHYAYEVLAYRNHVINHAGDATVNSIESSWAPIKRAYKGVYHRMSYRHLQSYANEICGRLNNRMHDSIDQMKLLIQGFVGKKLSYISLITRPEKPADMLPRMQPLL